MDLDELIDRYKNTNFLIRTAILLLIAIIPPALLYIDQGETLEQELQTSQTNFEVVNRKVSRVKRDVAELPELEKKLLEVERSLDKARRVLPKTVEFDEVLAQTGMYEKEIGVQVVRFMPGASTESAGGARYAEVPVELIVKSEFDKVMQFFDRMLHMEKLTHIRNITIKSAEDGKNPGVVEAKASLVLFRDAG